MILLGGHLLLDPSDVAVFMTEAAPIAALARAADGNQAFGLGVEDAEAGRITIFEAWDDEAAMHRHLARPETIALFTRWAPLMTNHVRKYDATNPRGPMD